MNSNIFFPSLSLNISLHFKPKLKVKTFLVVFRLFPRFLVGQTNKKICRGKSKKRERVSERRESEKERQSKIFLPFFRPVGFAYVVSKALTEDHLV